MPSKCLPVCLCPNHQWEYRFPRAGDKLECGKKQRPLDSKTSTTNSTRFSQYYVVLACEPVSFWQENRHSTTSFSENVEVTETSYQRLEVLLFCDWERV